LKSAATWNGTNNKTNPKKPTDTAKDSDVEADKSHTPDKAAKASKAKQTSHVGGLELLELQVLGVYDNEDMSILLNAPLFVFPRKAKRVNGE
jgi:hypothetical protein